MTQKIWAKRALTDNGWKSDVLIEISADGRISAITPDSPSDGTHIGTLLPAPVNLHSHAFQRAMAGLTERRGSDGRDSFWTWRELMYKFLDKLTPSDVEKITSFAQMQMLEAGFAGVAEFHYLHHQPSGGRYDNAAELSTRIVAAARNTGIGLTLLPVLYQYGGCDQRPLGQAQARFGNDNDQFATLYTDARTALESLPSDSLAGIAIHSLRAVSSAGIDACIGLAGNAPIHIHIAEQLAEVEEVQNYYGKRPVEWLLQNYDVNHQWCLVHATQMTSSETTALAQSGAVAGLCPITECNLGDGIFDGVHYLSQGGRFGVGSDSNIRISLTEELRTFEYSQRLRDHSRAALATDKRSTGHILMEGAAAGGAQAAGREAGAIKTGLYADLLALSEDAIDLAGKKEDALIDSFIFSAGDTVITDVWSAGRHVVQNGHHINHSAITNEYRQTITNLLSQL